MKMRIVSVLSIILSMLALSFSASWAAPAATITVNTLFDENDGSCRDGDCSLRDAIQVANSGANIQFSVTGTIVLTHGQLAIDKQLTITGPG
jgi:CSLREA domain-containing protein